ncbi:MAG: carbohydrate ABC transporter permease [Clostridia bacterium]|nr:carbohydrate ABC transporter permease [Clostridia bacterium]
MSKGGVQKTSKVFLIIGMSMLLLYTVSLLIPTFWAIITSFKERLDFITNKFGLPKVWTFDNYINAFDLLQVTVYDSLGRKDVYLSRMFFNSVIYALGCGFAHTLAPCLVSYAVAKYKFKFSGFIYNFVIVAMLLPSVGTLASEISIVKGLGIYDTFFGMFIMRFSFLGSNFLIFYAAFKSISWEYAEAGLMDGASHFKIFTQIMLPLVKTTFGAIFLLSFITYWNEYTTPMVFLPSNPTVAYGLYCFRFSPKSAITAVPMQMTACLLVSFPIFVVFVIFKNKIMGNLTMGGLKG